MTPDADGPLLKSLDLSLRVLASFESGTFDRGVTQLAREFGVSKATMYRVLATLEQHDFLVQDGVSEKYRLGPRLRRLGQAAAARFDLVAEARRFMTELRDRTEEAVHLAVRDGDEVVYLAKEEGLHAVQVVSHVGARCPAHGVSTGKVLLAHAGPAVLARLTGAGPQRYTDLTHASPQALADELARVRKHGYAINWGEWRREVRGVAAPVRDAGGTVIAALGICCPAARMTEERAGDVVPIVVEIAERLSAHLGAPTADSGAPGGVRVAAAGGQRGGPD